MRREKKLATHTFPLPPSPLTDGGWKLFSVSGWGKKKAEVTNIQAGERMEGERGEEEGGGEGGQQSFALAVILTFYVMKHDNSLHY